MSGAPLKTIVIVEDDRWLAESYQRLLVRGGYLTHHAADAAVAIDLIDDVRPELILLDVLLQRTTALALLHELRSHADLAAIPVILVTNLADDIPLDDVRAYGVVAIHDKGQLHPDELLASIRKALL